MPRLKMEKHEPLFLITSSSFGRQTVNVTFILLLLPSMCFSQADEESILAFCLVKREGEYKNGWNDDAMGVLSQKCLNITKQSLKITK